MADWLIGLLEVSVGAIALVACARRLLARRHYRTSDVTLVCPRTGTPVRCRLVVDGRSEKYVKVARCSRGQDGRPSCDQHCVRFLNLGIQLTPREPARRDERPDGAAPDAGEARAPEPRRDVARER